MPGRVVAAGSPIKVCVTNLICAPATTIIGSSELTASPATNIAKPGRPFLPWRTAAGGSQNVVIDFGSTKTITGLWLVHTNFATVTIQGNATDSWGAPTFAQTFTITRTPWNFRYNLSRPLVGFSFRFMRILIPSQTPLDGTSTYLLGGVYAGVTEVIPQGFRFEVDITTIMPAIDVEQQAGAWSQRLVMGEPLVSFSATRSARYTRLTPGYQDDLKLWLDLARRIRDNDIFAIALSTVDTSQGFVVRSINQNHWKWTMRTLLRSDSMWEFKEVTGP